MRNSTRVLAPALAAALATSLSSVTLAAQEVRGAIRETVGAQPIAGAVLLLLDSAGTTRARNISDAQGKYRVATSSWMKRMRVVRIGYRPTEVALPTLSLASDVAQIDVAMTSLPTLLEPVQVKSHTMCSARKDRVAALSLLEQARAGLLAAVVAQEKRPAEMIRLRAEATYDDNGDVRRLRVSTDSSKRVGYAFQAVRSAADFVKLGFYDERLESLYAPDAETLLDDDFRDGYCFVLRDRDAKRPTAVGLGFTPAKTKNGRVDVDGTLWIDTLARRLLQIDYAYLGLPRLLESASPAGAVGFQTLDNSVVIIDGWNIRLPWIEMDSTERNVDGRVKKMIVRVQSSGGVVATARWPDGFTWNLPLATARVKVIDAEGHPLPRRVLLLDDTDYQGVSDVNGVVTLTRLIPGPYSASMRDSTLAPIGVSLQTSLKFVVRDTVAIARTLVAPTASDYVADLCRSTSHDQPDPAAAWFVARVVDAHGNPVNQAAWRGWRFHAPREGASADADPWQELPNAGRTTSSDGLLAYCGNSLQPRDIVRVEVQVDKKTPPQAAEVTLTGPITAARLKVASPPKP